MTLSGSDRNDKKETEAYIQGLLVDEATQGLCERHATELDQLVERSELPASERNAWALTAAVCELALAAESEGNPKADDTAEPLDSAMLDSGGLDADVAAIVELPQDVEDRLAALVRQATRDSEPLLRRKPDRGHKVLQFDQRTGPKAVAEPTAAPEPAGRVERGSLLPWLVAAAAVVAAVGGWMRTPLAEGAGETVMAEAAVVETVPADQVILAFAATTDPSALGAVGELQWSSAEQAGVMRITGLAVNDPRTEQYQLWIFDSARDQRYPVDGGVFDVTSGEVSIPITAKVPVTEATLFAITVERPGGVVVSSRDRIVLTAAASA